ncbi:MULTISPECIES: hypothetical protein [unclassified Leucobacter]|uniref:hypothetical protein n=1 Tax=unclassified Leucobacter TaxID=2621730 RepID=UPI00165E8BF1|nr:MULTISPECIES: hypothetical protein [unclassified Leucobacter]MBC9936514.1 hypothetical protein [Leucobacter sp. cx-87]
MSRGRRVGIIVGALIIAGAAICAIVFGVVGISQTVTAGTQPRVCGVTLGVTSSDQGVRLLGASDATLVPGDRVRVGPMCVVEVISIDDSGVNPDADGGGARVQLKWRLW